MKTKGFVNGAVEGGAVVDVLVVPFERDLRAMRRLSRLRRFDQAATVARNIATAAENSASVASVHGSRTTIR